MFDQLTEISFLGNSLLAYLRSLIFFAGGLLIGVILHVGIGKRLRRLSDNGSHSNRWWIAEAAFRRVLVPLLYISVVRLSLIGLTLPISADKVLKGLISAVVALLVVRTTRFVLETSLRRYANQTGRTEDENRIKPLLSLVSFLLWIIAAIFLLDNLGFNISTLVAGLGVSGIAVAIAAQGILGDLFNYFGIYFDRPFELGDFIIFDDQMGSVEKIGIKSTRLRALSGEQIIVPNSDLVGSRVHNYKRMERRRVLYRFGVTYQTPPEKLAEIPVIIKSIIEEVDNTVFDRSHFQGYGDFALTFETVYYVTSSDYAVYMDAQQAINLQMYRTFEKRGIEFAYPTQTILLSSEKKMDTVE